MKTICDYKSCTGCEACFNICPSDAIKMQELGPLGFSHPSINKDDCIDCGLCAKICPINSPVSLHYPVKAFACVCKDDTATQLCASGGASYGIAASVIIEGGIVYGCEMKSCMSVSHCRYSNLEDMIRMRGSKYVQSSIGITYKNVKTDLEKGFKVLFTGTPCQVAGLRSFLRKKYDNFFCIDLVCHGVPSQKLLRDDICFMAKKNNIKAPLNKPITFRKKISNLSSDFDVKFGTFVESEIPINDQEFFGNNYITAFMHGLTFRDNCYNCKYAQPKRVGDITVADFWGLGKSSLIKRGHGVSLLLVSTEKGDMLKRKAEEILMYEERPVAEAINGNGQLNYPSISPKGRKQFEKAYCEMGSLAYDSYLREYRRAYRRLLLRKSLTSKYGSHTLVRKIISIYFILLNKLRPTIKAI